MPSGQFGTGECTYNTSSGNFIGAYVEATETAPKVEDNTDSLYLIEIKTDGTTPGH